MSEKRLGLTRMVSNAGENRHDHAAIGKLLCDLTSSDKFATVVAFMGNEAAQASYVPDASGPGCKEWPELRGTPISSLMNFVSVFGKRLAADSR